MQEMRQVMQGFAATEDDLLFLRLSLGVNAKEADVDHLAPEMVKAYQQTNFAKFIACRSSAGSLAKGKRNPQWAEHEYTHICTRCERKVYLRHKSPGSGRPPVTVSSSHECKGKTGTAKKGATTPSSELRLIKG